MEGGILAIPVENQQSSTEHVVGHASENRMPCRGTKVGDFGTLYRYSEAKSTCIVGDESKDNPLVVLFAWLGVSEGAVGRYVKQYIRRNVDVLVVHTSAMEFLRPHLGKQLARKVLDHLLYTQQEYDRFLVHAFSVGAYTFTLCSLLVQDSSERYGSFTNRLEGIILDSAVVGTLENMAIGVSKMSSKNYFIRSLSFYMVMLYLKLATSTADFYSYVVELIFSGPFDKPSLFFYCHNDPMCDSAALERLIANWKSKHQSPVMTRAWDDSVHTAHLKIHTTDYVESLDEFCRNLPHFFKGTVQRKRLSSKM